MKIVAKPSEREQNSGSEKGSLETTQTTHKKKLKGGWGRKIFQAKQTFLFHIFRLISETSSTSFATARWLQLLTAEFH